MYDYEFEWKTRTASFGDYAEWIMEAIDSKIPDVFTDIADRVLDEYADCATEGKNYESRRPVIAKLIETSGPKIITETITHKDEWGEYNTYVFDNDVFASTLRNSFFDWKEELGVEVALQPYGLRDGRCGINIDY